MNSMFMIGRNLMKKHRNGLMGMIIMLKLVLSTAPYKSIQMECHLTMQSVNPTVLDNMSIDRNNMNLNMDMMNGNYGGLMSVISCC